MIKLDLEHVERRSVWLNILIQLRTVPAGLSLRGASQILTRGTGGVRNANSTLDRPSVYVVFVFAGLSVAERGRHGDRWIWAAARADDRPGGRSFDPS